MIANCPGVLSRSTRSLISVISSGTRWISSIATGVSSVAMNPAGSIGGGGADRLVVERQDVAAGSLGGRDLFEQRALADLTGAEHDDDARIGQCRLDGALGVSGDESRWGICGA